MKITSTVTKTIIILNIILTTHSYSNTFPVGYSYYIKGEFKKSKNSLKNAFRSSTSAIQKAKILKFIAVNQFMLKDKKSAKKNFIKAIKLNPEMTLLSNELIDSSVLKFFRKIKRKLKKTTLKSTSKTKQNLSKVTAKEIRKAYQGKKRLSFNDNSNALTLLPFGIGQYQNGNHLFGALMTLSQMGSLYLFYTNTIMEETVIHNAQTKISSDQYTAEEKLEINANSKKLIDKNRKSASIGAGAFLGLWVLSVIHALANSKEEAIARIFSAPPLSPEYQIVTHNLKFAISFDTYDDRQSPRGMLTLELYL